jgi:polyamine oxidase
MRKTVLFLTTLASVCYAKTYDTKVVILGGGVSGIHAAINLTASGINDFMLVEARDILGGNVSPHLLFF